MHACIYALDEVAKDISEHLNKMDLHSSFTLHLVVLLLFLMCVEGRMPLAGMTLEHFKAEGV